MRFDQLAAISGGQLHNAAAAARTFAGVSIDTRTLKPGQLFVALRGEKVDGHSFISQALAAGASGVVVEFAHPELLTMGGDIPVVAVVNSHEAMIKLAVAYRDMVAAKRVGITGSNGKTTTKEFLYELIQVVQPHVYRSSGNLNNLFGLPLALMAMPHDTKVAVLELGISLPGEMARLAPIARPHLVVITNVGASHLEFLKTIEGVAREKISLVSFAEPGTKAVVNGDDAVLMEEIKRQGKSFVTFGVNNRADVMPESMTVGDDGVTLVRIEGNTFRLPLFGRHHVYNLLAAYAAFKTLGYTFAGIDTRSIELSSANMRGQVMHSHDVTFIADCYNANPDSMRSGLNSLATHAGGTRRVLVLGDMLELGDAGEEAHREIGRQLAKMSFDVAFLVGPSMKQAFDEALALGVPASRLVHFADARACARETAGYFRAGDLVYIKGSRGVGLELILKPWEKPEGTI